MLFKREDEAGYETKRMINSGNELMSIPSCRHSVGILGPVPSVVGACETKITYFNETFMVDQADVSKERNVGSLNPFPPRLDGRVQITTRLTPSVIKS